eukprot:4439209-Pleurochrysis_carterae.AAC.1
MAERAAEAAARNAAQETAPGAGTRGERPEGRRLRFELEKPTGATAAGAGQTAPPDASLMAPPPQRRRLNSM